MNVALQLMRPAKSSALNLFHIGPGLQRALEIYNLSAVKPFILALAVADFNIFIKYSFDLLFTCKDALSGNHIFAADNIGYNATLLGEILKNFPSAFEIILCLLERFFRLNTAVFAEILEGANSPIYVRPYFRL